MLFKELLEVLPKDAELKIINNSTGDEVDIAQDKIREEPLLKKRQVARVESTGKKKYNIVLYGTYYQPHLGDILYAINDISLVCLENKDNGSNTSGTALDLKNRNINIDAYVTKIEPCYHQLSEVYLKISYTTKEE